MSKNLFEMQVDVEKIENDSDKNTGKKVGLTSKNDAKHGFAQQIGGSKKSVKQNVTKIDDYFEFDLVAPKKTLAEKDVKKQQYESYAEFDLKARQNSIKSSKSKKIAVETKAMPLSEKSKTAASEKPKAALEQKGNAEQSEKVLTDKEQGLKESSKETLKVSSNEALKKSRKETEKQTLKSISKETPTKKVAAKKPSETLPKPSANKSERKNDDVKSSSVKISLTKIVEVRPRAAKKEKSIELGAKKFLVSPNFKFDHIVVRQFKELDGVKKNKADSHVQNRFLEKIKLKEDFKFLKILDNVLERNQEKDRNQTRTDAALYPFDSEIERIISIARIGSLFDCDSSVLQF